MSQARDNRRLLYRLARSQEGIVSRRQLDAAGVSRTTIESWLKTGRLIPGYEGAYSLGQPISSIEGWWMAAVLAAGDGAVLAGFSATRALGFGKGGTRIEVARPAGRRRVLEPRIGSGYRAEIRKAVLLPEDVTLVGPVPVMRTARALLDVAGRSSASRLRREFIEAGRHNHLTESTLDQCRERGRMFRHRARLEWLVDAWNSGRGRIRSTMEGEFRIFCFERSIPAPETNAIVCGEEVDGLWRDQGVIVELDSRQFHSDGFAFENDRGKSNRLALQGYVLLRITWKMLMRDPDGVERMIRQALERGKA